MPLVLTRREGESVFIGEGPNQITVTVNYIDRGKVRLAFSCSREIPILRSELVEIARCRVCGKESPSSPCGECQAATVYGYDHEVE